MVMCSQIKLIFLIYARNNFKECMARQRIIWGFSAVDSAIYGAEEISLPILEKVKFAVIKLKINKDLGPDGLNAELSKID
jgi:hypothetical protein